MEPVSFGNCFGWLHNGQASRGVVLMSPFGFEELCARKTFALLGQALAARGIPVLRFDWSGTGDSLGGPNDIRQFDHWRNDARDAVATLKALTGVKEIVVVGLRLGALLAADAACARDDVSRLVLLAPPASGKAWLREAATFARVMSVPGAASTAADGLEVAGFRIGADSVEAIRTTEWGALTACPAPQVDIFVQQAGGGERIEHYMNLLGAHTACHTFQGYDALMCDPTASQAPMALIEKLAEDMAAKAPAATRAVPRPAFAPLTGHGFSETPARLGVDQNMAGILCHPIERTSRSEAVIFLNAGAIHHAGWARMYVDMSRRLARHGVASLRLDLPGIGDSAMLGDPPVASLYARRMSGEVTQAIDWLKGRGYRRITLAGACSGAYQAFHAALDDERVDGLVLLNQLCFVWGASYAMQFNAWQATKSRSLNAQLSSASADETLDAARTLARLMPIAKKVAKGGLSALMSLQTYASQAFAREKSVEAAFIKLSSRGARIMLAYSAGDAGLAELERHLGHEGIHATSLPGVCKRIIENADHMLTPAKARAEFAEEFVAFLDANVAEEETPQRDRALASA